MDSQNGFRLSQPEAEVINRLRQPGHVLGRPLTRVLLGRRNPPNYVPFVHPYFVGLFGFANQIRSAAPMVSQPNRVTIPH